MSVKSGIYRCSFVSSVKRLISILFLLIYATTAFGITIDFHYCQGKMVKSSLLNIRQMPDCCCQEEASHPVPALCCNDDVRVCETDNHKTAQPAISTDLIGHPVVIRFLNYKFLPNSLNQQRSKITFANPERETESIYLLCRVFRI